MIERPRRRRAARPSVRRLAALAVLLAFGCGEDPLAPFEPEINSAPDNFQFQATGLKTVTTSKEYSWQNSGPRATINHSSALTDGNASITVTDAAGAHLYTSDLLPSGTVSTPAGVPGTWKIRVQLSKVSGTLNFRVQKL